MNENFFMKKKQTTFSCQNMTASRIHCMFITFYAVTFESSVAYFCLFCCYLLFIFAVIFCLFLLLSFVVVFFIVIVIFVVLCFYFQFCMFIYVFRRYVSMYSTNPLRLYLALYCSYFTLVLLSTLL